MIGHGFLQCFGCYKEGPDVTCDNRGDPLAPERGGKGEAFAWCPECRGGSDYVEYESK